jgi:hypothetical protein
MGFSCCALLLTAAAKAAPPPAPGAGAVSADVHWVGLCNNRPALERALQQRGAHLEKPGASTPIDGSERFTVDVEVSASDGPHSFAARFEIQGANGTRDVRQVEADRCEELHTTVAWVLLVLARAPRVGDDNDAASGNKTLLARGTPASDPAAARNLTPTVALANANAQAIGESTATVRVVYASVLPKAHPRFALGAQMMADWGFLREPAWGPAMFFEHRPFRADTVAGRLTLLSMTNGGSTADSSIAVAVRRSSARFGAWFRVPRVPVAFTSGFEVGLLSARGSGAVVSRQTRSVWGAAFAGIVLEFPLLHDRLWLEAGADASLSPFTYAFRTSSERTIVASSPVELRTAAGLKSTF